MSWWYHPAVLFFGVALAGLTLTLLGRLLVLCLQLLGVCADDEGPA